MYGMHHNVPINTQQTGNILQANNFSNQARISHTVVSRLTCLYQESRSHPFVCIIYSNKEEQKQYE